MQSFCDNLFEFAGGGEDFDLTGKDGKYNLDFYLNDMGDYHIVVQLMKILHNIGATSISGSYDCEFMSGTWKIDSAGNVQEEEFEEFDI